MIQKSSRLLISFCIAGIVGAAFVRAFFLDALEQIGGRMSWTGIGNGRPMGLGMVVPTASLAQGLTGLVIGGAAGALMTHTRRDRLAQPTENDGD
jgi:hypothetical protein